MNDNIAIQLFEGNQIRIVWDAEAEKYWFSIVDVVQVLTESVDGRKYWNKLKQRLVEEGNETVTNCHQLKDKGTGTEVKTNSEGISGDTFSVFGYYMKRIEN